LYQLNVQIAKKHFYDINITIKENQIKGYKLIEAPEAQRKWWEFWK